MGKLLNKKLFYHKSITQRTDDFPIREKSKLHYLLNQFLIWIIIISTLLFIINFLNH